MKIKDHFLSLQEFELLETDIDGILKTNPIPIDIGKYYDSKLYISHHQDNGSLKERLYKFLQSINIRYKKRIINQYISNSYKPTLLDYGCGAGEFVKYIANDLSTYGFEPNDNARKSAQQKNNKTIFIDSLDEIKDNSLDIITLWHVFEHIEQQQEILYTFQKKLNSNGKLIIAVPNYTSYDAQKYREFWAAYDVPRHIYHFSKNGMLKLMNNHLWEVEKIHPLLLDSFYISLLSEKYKKNPLGIFSGIFYGLISNIYALKTGEYSSLIYIIKKKNIH